MKNNIDALFSTKKLRCPNCAVALQPSDSTACSNCGVKFPAVSDIPVLAANPAELVGLWQNRYANYVSGQQRNIQSNLQLIATPSTYPPLARRLRRISQARKENLEAIMQLMAPVRMMEPGTQPATHADSTGFFLTLVYLFRDWGWGEEEIDTLCNKVVDIMPAGVSPQSLLVLGAGGCRTSFNLHNHYHCPLTVSVDISPLMLLGAARIVSGGKLDLHQILPNNVRDERGNLSYWKLTAPRKPDNDFLFMLADATRLPFLENSFHVVLTPFIIDEIGIDLREFASKIRNVLEPGGYWFNYGAMTFLPGFNYTAEEVLAIVNEAGFRVLQHGFSTQPHAAPIASCQRQVFDCLYFSAIKC